MPSLRDDRASQTTFGRGRVGGRRQRRAAVTSPTGTGFLPPPVERLVRFSLKPLTDSDSPGSITA
jgi:hypothetical protein